MRELPQFVVRRGMVAVRVGVGAVEQAVLADDVVGRLARAQGVVWGTVDLAVRPELVIGLIRPAAGMADRGEEFAAVEDVVRFR